MRAKWNVGASYAWVSTQTANVRLVSSFYAPGHPKPKWSTGTHCGTAPCVCSPGGPAGWKGNVGACSPRPAFEIEEENASLRHCLQTRRTPNVAVWVCRSRLLQKQNKCWYQATTDEGWTTINCDVHAEYFAKQVFFSHILTAYWVREEWSHPLDKSTMATYLLCTPSIHHYPIRDKAFLSVHKRLRAFDVQIKYPITSNAVRTILYQRLARKLGTLTSLMMERRHVGEWLAD